MELLVSIVALVFSVLLHRLWDIRLYGGVNEGYGIV